MLPWTLGPGNRAKILLVGREICIKAIDWRQRLERNPWMARNGWEEIIQIKVINCSFDSGQQEQDVVDDEDSVFFSPTSKACWLVWARGDVKPVAGGACIPMDSKYFPLPSVPSLSHIPQPRLSSRPVHLFYIGAQTPSNFNRSFISAN